MRTKLLKLAGLLLLTALLLTSCGYMVVEDAPVQAGSTYLTDDGQAGAGAE